MPPPRALGQSASAQAKLVREIRSEWEAWVKERGHRLANGEIVYSERLIAELGSDALATLRYLTVRGDRESARFLAERMLGAPEQPYHVRISNFSVEEAEEYLRREILALNLSPESAAAIVARIDSVSALPPACVEENDDGS